MIDFSSHWPECHVGTLGSPVSGLAFRPQDAKETPGSDLIACFRTSNIQQKLEEHDVLFIPRSLLRSERQLLQDGDLLISTANSDNLVGKCVIVENLLYEATLGGFISAFRVDSSLVTPRYFYYWLSSPIIQARMRSLARRTTNIANLAMSDFVKVKISLPTLSEQQRIVGILQEAEEIRNLRTKAEAKIVKLIPAMFCELFGEIGSNSKGWPVVPISNFVESFQGGKSITGIEGDFDTSRPRVLKISAVTSGFLLASESKALPSTYEPPDEHYVKTGDLLITRANTEELVGATSLVGNKCPANLVLPDKIWRFVWKEGFKGTPEFVWALFQEQSTRKALGKIATGTGGSMKNISMKKLMQMRVVWPPKELQETFSKALREVRHLYEASDGDKVTQNLISSLSAHAFSGQLTADWREANKDKLANEARERDAALKEAGATFSRTSRTMADEIEEMLQDRTDGIYADLNREQRYILSESKRMVGGVHYARYFTAEQLSRYLNDGPLRRNPQAVEGHLAVLAARGLIIPVSREDQTEDTGEYVFGNAYRLPLLSKENYLTDDQGGVLATEADEELLAEQVIGDDARLRELERLAAQLKKERFQI